MKIELDDKDWKLLEKHLGIYVEKNYLKLDPHFIDLYNQILEQHYASKVKELKEWLLQKLEKTNLNYLFKNLGGYSMDSKTREKILHRCEILRYMGDDGISCIFDQLPDDELMEDCGWVLDKAHDDLDNFQFGLTRKIINKAAARSANDMWSESWTLTESKSNKFM